MSFESSYGCKEIQINENDYLAIEKKGKDNQSWEEITFKTNNGANEIFIGSYYTNNYSNSIEWMEYNKNFVAILKTSTTSNDITDIQIKVLFDIQSKKLISGTQEELLEIYKREFEVNQKFDVLAVPYRRAFVVAPEKTEEFKKAAKILKINSNLKKTK